MTLSTSCYGKYSVPPNGEAATFRNEVKVKLN
jgi:hypothetical protein